METVIYSVVAGIVLLIFQVACAARRERERKRMQEWKERKWER